MSLDENPGAFLHSYVSINTGEYLIKSTYYDTIENVLPSYLQGN